MSTNVNVPCRPAPARASAAGALILSLLLTSPANGQPSDQPSGQPGSQTDAQPGEAAPPPRLLEGPRIESTPTATTLVHRDMSGMLQPLDVRPERAAVDLLELSPEQRAPIDAFFEERGKATARLVSDNYELVLRLVNAFQAGASTPEVAPLLREFYPVARELLEPSLQSLIAERLPEPSRGQFNDLVDQYKLETAKDFARKNGAPAPEGDSLAPMQERRLEGLLLLKEVGSSVKGTVSDLQTRADEFMKRIQATPEQESKIRAAFQNSKNLLRPTPEERRAMMRQIWPILTPEQRQILLRSRDE